MPMTVSRQVDRHAGNRCREVRPVIEVEPAEVVLIRLAFAAVLADDDAGHGFEDFARAHHRPRVELSAGNCALARGLRDAEEVLRGIGRIRQVGEGALPSHRHVGAQ